MKLDYLIINDILTPWREPVFERVWKKLAGQAVHALYFKSNEQRRLWTFHHGTHPKTVLRGWTLRTGGTERFLNPGIVPFLLKSRPRAALVIANIKDPSALLAMLMCRLLGIKIALLDDSWMGRERNISCPQRLARRLVYNCFCDAYVGASRQTLALGRHYNPRLRDEQMFLSHLVADNDFFQQKLQDRQITRDFEILFSGRIVPVKNPAFFAEVCAGIKKKLGRCRVLIIGEGEESLKSEMRQIFEAGGVDYEFAGFIQHDSLPDYYSRAKLLLLPTSGDCWGVVINEAMISGTPVITTELTAAAGELVIDGENGHVLPLDASRWVAAASELLMVQDKWDRFSRNALSKAMEFNYDRAADGVISALQFLDQRRAVPAANPASTVGVA